LEREDASSGLRGIGCAVVKKLGRRNGFGCIPVELIPVVPIAVCLAYSMTSPKETSCLRFGAASRVGSAVLEDRRDSTSELHNFGKAEDDIARVGANPLPRHDPHITPTN
jgi:hypothetical protein